MKPGNRVPAVDDVCDRFHRDVCGSAVTGSRFVDRSPATAAWGASASVSWRMRRPRGAQGWSRRKKCHRLQGSHESAHDHRCTRIGVIERGDVPAVRYLHVGRVREVLGYFACLVDVGAQVEVTVEHQGRGVRVAAPAGNGGSATRGFGQPMQ